MRWTFLKLCTSAVVAAMSCSCAPSAKISSSKFDGYDGNARKLLVAYEMSPSFVDSNTIRARMGNLLATCGVDSRFIFIEANYGQTSKDRQQKIIQQARANIGGFEEEAILEISEKSKQVLVNYKYNTSVQNAAVFDASIFDQKRKAKVWVAQIDLTSGNIMQNNKDRAEVLSRNLMAHLINDGAIQGCPATTLEAVKAARQQ